MTFLKSHVFWIFVLTILQFTQVKAESISGEWEGKPYSFTFWSSDIDGHWGDDRYDINFWSSDIDGELMGQRFDVNFWSSDIDGVLPCGNFDINIWSSELEGEICGQDFTIELSDGENGKDMAFRVILNEMMRYIPSPAKKSIRKRIRVERRDRGWMK